MNPCYDLRKVDAHIACKVERGAEKLGRFQAVKDWFYIQRGVLRVAYYGSTTSDSIIAACKPKEYVN